MASGTFELADFITWRELSGFPLVRDKGHRVKRAQLELGGGRRSWESWLCCSRAMPSSAFLLPKPSTFLVTFLLQIFNGQTFPPSQNVSAWKLVSPSSLPCLTVPKKTMGFCFEDSLITSSRKLVTRAGSRTLGYVSQLSAWLFRCLDSVGHKKLALLLGRWPLGILACAGVGVYAPISSWNAKLWL